MLAAAAHETGLLYYNFRWYDPLVGQFTRADTSQTNANGMNPYAYVRGNPETKNDPTGHEDAPWWVQLLQNPIVMVVVAIALTPAGFGAGLLIASSIGIMTSGDFKPSQNPYGSGPEPEPVPTPEASPQTNTNGGMCRTSRCYDLTSAEGYLYAYPGYDYYAHTIKNHVNISDSEVRFNADRPAKKGGTGRYTAFNDLDTAEWAVQYLLDHADLSQIAPGISKTLAIDTGQNIGWGYQKGNPNKVTNLTSLSVWVYRDASGELHVMDAFPLLDRYVPPSPTTESPHKYEGRYS